MWPGKRLDPDPLDPPHGPRPLNLKPEAPTAGAIVNISRMPIESRSQKERQGALVQRQEGKV
ncbi:hypothetical protein AURDEDRAFT_110873 [Auricularia subglabra TFB-10046 SS5]|nr:hypothetical protein AURDEDRAFT_110873 [Auricularia subglabra TFB-10046 SS5]